MDLECGTRVQIDFNHRPVTGFVEDFEETGETEKEAAERLGFTPKKIDAVLDQESLITPELHELAMWMRETTLSTAISCFQAMLPSKIKPVSSGKKAVSEKWVRLSDAETVLTPKQLEAYLYVKENQPVRYSLLRSKYPNQARALVEKNAVDIFEKEKEAGDTGGSGNDSPFVLNEEQQRAYDEIRGSSDPVFLVHGVTGSGKTELYLRLAANALSQGSQVLILVPEIALTPQMIARVSDRFGAGLAIYHSGLNAQEKYEQYRMVKTGRASVVVGTRSAVFLPFRKLGLIVMDEEHDSSYKQENQPAYHCRDIAVWRGAWHRCPVILGSATPSLESYARAVRHVYHLIRLSSRINQTVPQVTVIPLKESMKKGQSYIISDPLKNKIRSRLDAHQQVILLLNRRGYSSMLRCRSCLEAVVCPHCDIAMSYHHDEKVMKCHTCGTSMPVPSVCPKCGQKSGFMSYGYGTQRLEAELQGMFPDARMLRMDADTTARKNGHEKILTAFGQGKADILLGTQMIAKGLDYPNVTLVGILNGDEGLSRTDYRSCEITFDLLMQAGGRSGRAKEAGEVVYQVFDPGHYAVQCSVKNDYETFFVREMQFRHAGMYPPYTYLIALTVSGLKRNEVEKTALWLKNSLNGSYKTIGVIELLKIQDRIRSRIILKGRDLDEMRSDIRKLFDTDEYKKAGDIRIDVNPITLD